MCKTLLVAACMMIANSDQSNLPILIVIPELLNMDLILRCHDTELACMLQPPSEGPAMTDVALVCEEHDPQDGSVHGQLSCSKDVFDLASAERLAANLQVGSFSCACHQQASSASLPAEVWCSAYSPSNGQSIWDFA